MRQRNTDALVNCKRENKLPLRAVISKLRFPNPYDLYRNTYIFTEVGVFQSVL
jgi:hypothetical protein